MPKGNTLILYTDGGTEAQEAEANNIIEALTTAYPGYPWAVKVYDGGFFIRNLMFPKNWGMNQPNANKYGSASEMKKDVIMKAGEWLERANLKRGRNINEDEIVRLEGAPEHDQPNRPLPDNIKIALPEGYNPEAPQLRDTPRPQALHG
jgi:hypothetical protein